MGKYVTTVSLGIIQAYFLFILCGAGVGDEYETCTDGAIDLIRNGYCDLENNNEGCQYDGGDCCSCSCVYGLMFDCGTSGFSCLDPYFADMEPYICEELSPLPSFCSAELQHEWIVDNTTQARALAGAVRCPGESFNVTWKGKVIVDETILIFNGTFLNVTSVDGDTSIIGGDGKTRLFAVVNASLYLSNITLNRGNADYGGAISASRSRLNFHQVALTGNTAFNGGGAVWLSNSILTFFGEETSLVNNTALDGGALYMTGGSNASWTGNTTFYENTSAALGKGGALCVTNGSNVVWTATSHFLNNSALLGGSLYVSGDSSAAWTAASQFIDNIASTGGALYVTGGSSAVWNASSYFLENSAEGGGGGALYMAYDSSASWNAVSQFIANSAYYGGALCMFGGSKAIWTSASTFLANNAYDGGAVYIWLASSAVWTSESHLLLNSAVSHGGALYLMYSSSVSWAANTTFSENAAKAGNGGALYLEDSTAIWTGPSQFLTNFASSYGGAVYVVYNSTAAWEAPSSFTNNTCGAHGGSLAMVQSLTVLFDNNNTTFLQNTADVSGGVVFIAGIVIGPVFRNVIFVKNYAQTGGGVHATGSGTAMTLGGDKEQMQNPTTFDGCIFIGNFAFATGGAVDSASGQDLFVRTLFKGNVARAGGALRLGGMTSIDDCAFDDNISELGEGPTVSNVGYISNFANSYFQDNSFDCEPQAFLDFNESEDLFGTVCNGCPDTCIGCSFGDTRGSPTCTSLSQAGVEHVTSNGGTIENLRIHKGYWRATNTSVHIFKCFSSNACAGGLTGASAYCLLGYEGPYCSVCSKNYVSSLSYTCRECSSHTVGISVAIAIIVLAAAVGFIIVAYILSAEGIGTGRGIVDRMMRRVPMQSVKIVIIVWQILTQFASVANVTFPNVYHKLLDVLDVFNFDLGLVCWVLPRG